MQNFQRGSAEEAKMVLNHAGDMVRGLAPLIADMAPVEYVLKATEAKLNGRVPASDVIKIFLPSDLKTNLQEIIVTFDFRNELDEQMTPAELYTAIYKAAELYVESLLEDILELFTTQRPRWIANIIKEHEGEFSQ